LKHHELLRLLESKKIVHQEQLGFREMVPGVMNEARIVCAEIERPDGFHGISFWLYGENDTWFLGLWSGIYLAIKDPTTIPVIVSDLLSGEVVDRGSPPGDLPEEFCQRHELTRESN
jgi:hypothetical protein